MRVLIYGLNFYPELIGIGKYTGELAEYLSSRGHEIRVVAAKPYYPSWVIDPQYQRRGYIRKQQPHQTRVTYTPVWVPDSISPGKRILHLLSFAAASLPALFAQLFWKPHILITVIPTFFTLPVAWIFTKLAGCASWLHIQDFEIDAMFQLGMVPGRKIIYPIASKLERFLYCRFDRISTISGKMSQLLQRKGVLPKKTNPTAIWVDTESIYPKGNQEMSRQQFNFPREKIIALYAGNLGKKQGLELLISAAGCLKEEDNIIIVIGGDGSERKEILQQSRSTELIQILPLQPAEKFNDLLNAADIHLLPQKAGAADLVMPSKLLGMLASGKPVIATADEDTEIGKTLRQVGVLVDPGDPAALAYQLKSLAADPLRRARLGADSRKLAVETWSKSKILSGWEEHLAGLFKRN